MQYFLVITRLTSKWISATLTARFFCEKAREMREHFKFIGSNGTISYLEKAELNFQYFVSPHAIQKFCAKNIEDLNFDYPSRYLTRIATRILAGKRSNFKLRQVIWNKLRKLKTIISIGSLPGKLIWLAAACSFWQKPRWSILIFYRKKTLKRVWKFEDVFLSYS